MPVNHETTIANPPPLGVGITWELLSLGTSTILCLVAIFIITPVNVSEAEKRDNNNSINLIINVLMISLIGKNLMAIIIQDLFCLYAITIFSIPASVDNGALKFNSCSVLLLSISKDP